MASGHIAYSVLPYQRTAVQPRGSLPLGRCDRLTDGMERLMSLVGEVYYGCGQSFKAPERAIPEALNCGNGKVATGVVVLNN